MRCAPRVLLLLLCLQARCYAFSKFETHCSVPSHSVNYVSSPNSRGTLDILWSCLFTLVACTWTIQHLNVPEQRVRARDSSVWCDVKWALWGFWSNLKWMIITMLAPEFILGKAFGDLSAARYYRDLMQEFAEKDEVEWSLTHCFYANMGGFMGIEDEPQDNTEGKLNAKGTVPLLASSIDCLRRATDSQNGSKPGIKLLPDIKTAELLDKSKGDAFVKCIAVSQVLWVALQVIVRAARGLPISLLELATAAFCCCAIATYIALYNKPKNVGVPSQPIRCERGSIEEANKTEGTLLFRNFFINFSQAQAVQVRPAIRLQRIPNDVITLESDELYAFRACMWGFIGGGVIFGIIHVFGWNFTFPTPVEQQLWQCSSILSTILLPIILAPAIFGTWSQLITDNGRSTYLTTGPVGRRRRGNVLLSILEVPNIAGVPKEWGSVHIYSWPLWNLALGSLYVIVRLFMLVEIFRTLLYLPPGVYISTWARSSLHVNVSVGCDWQ